MEKILAVIVQFLFEILFDVFLQISFDWPSRNPQSAEP
jgi:hypothetical protein